MEQKRRQKCHTKFGIPKRSALGRLPRKLGSLKRSALGRLPRKLGSLKCDFLSENVPLGIDFEANVEPFSSKRAVKKVVRKSAPGNHGQIQECNAKIKYDIIENG